MTDPTLQIIITVTRREDDPNDADATDGRYIAAIKAALDRVRETVGDGYVDPREGHSHVLSNHNGASAVGRAAFHADGSRRGLRFSLRATNLTETELTVLWDALHKVQS